MVFPLAILAGETALAEPLVLYNPDTEIISICGESYGESAIIMLYKYGITPSDSNLPIEFEVISLENGSFSAEIKMPTGADKTTYTVKVSTNEGNFFTDFVYFKLSEADTVVDLLADTKKQAFISTAKTNAQKLGIDTLQPLYISDGDYILSLLYTTKNSITDGLSFYNGYQAAFAAASFKSCNAEQVIKKYDTFLGISFESDYKSKEGFSIAAKAELASLLKEENFEESLSSKTFKTIYKELQALAAVNTADSAADLEKIIEVYFSDMFSDLPNVGGSVYSKMMSMPCKTFEDIAINFDIANKPAKQPTISGGGGGGVSKENTYSKDTTAEIFVPADGGQESVETETEIKNVSFGDVNANNWYYDSVMALASRCIISGYTDGNFKAESDVTRAEFTKLVYSALGDRFPQVKKISGRVTKLPCVGDSLTQGLIDEDGTYTKNIAYADFLKELLGEEYEVKNFGRSSHGILENHKYPYLSTDEYKQSLKYVPDILVTMFGTNDIKTDYWADAKSIYKERYEYFINTYKTINPEIQVIIMLPPPFFTNDNERPIENLKEGIEILKQVAADGGYTTLDLYSVFDGAQYLFPDLLHFNSEGARKAAQTIANTLLGSEAAEFEDVNDEWFAEYVNAAAAAGLVQGSNGKFLPDSFIKREDASLIIYRALSKIGNTLAGVPAFTDNINIAPYAFSAVGGLSKYKILQGSDGAFSPKANITRAQAAQLIYNALSFLGEIK